MKRTTSPPQRKKPSREQGIKGIMRTVKKLQIQYGADPEDPFVIQASIDLKEPYWKGWVVSFPFRREQFIACIHYLDLTFKLTPAGNVLLCSDLLISQLTPHIIKLTREKNSGL